jgi:hypothetical protein
MKYEGKVSKKLYAPGSKSEHEAVMINLDEGEFLLKRVGGNPFVDPVLESLVGKTIRCEGTLKETSLFITDWEEV